MPDKTDDTHGDEQGAEVPDHDSKEDDAVEDEEIKDVKDDKDNEDDDDDIVMRANEHQVADDLDDSDAE